MTSWLVTTYKGGLTTWKNQKRYFYRPKKPLKDQFGWTLYGWTELNRKRTSDGYFQFLCCFSNSISVNTQKHTICSKMYRKCPKVVSWRYVHPYLDNWTYGLNVTTPEGYNPKKVRSSDITTSLRYGPWLHVHPCFDLDVLSHIAQCPTSFIWIVTWWDRTERREVWHSSQYKTAGTG